jgi:hypothetical protein
MRWEKETSPFSCFTIAIGVRPRFWDHIPPGKASIIKALDQENDIGDRVVGGKNDHGRQNALKDGAEDVEDIPGQPNDDELEGQPIG